MTKILAALAVLTSSLALAQNVPGSISFNARLTDTGGAPVTGSHALGFGLYDQTSGGAAVWTENVSGASFSTDGVAYVELGAQTPLTASALDGRKLYLEVSVDGTTLTPRLAVVSVPYAIRASVAATAGTIGSLTESNIQRRVTGTCPSGQAVKSIDSAGGVLCEPVSGGSGGGDITGVTTASTSGLTGGSMSGDVALSLATCASGEVLKSNGTGWACASDNANGITASAGLAVTGSNIGLIPCAAGQVLKAGATAGTWACGADNDSTSTYAPATTTVDGLMSAADKTKLDQFAAVGSIKCVEEYDLIEQGTTTRTYWPAQAKRAELMQYGWLCWNRMDDGVKISPLDNVTLSEWYGSWATGNEKVCGRINWMSGSADLNRSILVHAQSSYYYGLREMNGTANTWHGRWAYGGAEGSAGVGTGDRWTIYTCR